MHVVDDGEDRRDLVRRLGKLAKATGSVKLIKDLDALENIPTAVTAPETSGDVPRDHKVSEPLLQLASSPNQM